MKIEKTLSKIAELTLARNQLAQNLNVEVLNAKKKYEPDIAKLDKQIADEQAKAEAWANENKATAFATEKSMSLPTGVIGFRVCPPSVSFLEGVTEKIVIARLKELDLEQFIRTKEELAKADLVKQRETLTAEQLTKLGIEITRQEKFFLDVVLTA